MSFVTTFFAETALIVPSTLDFLLGISSRSIVDALALELKLESDHSDGEDKEQSVNSRRKNTFQKKKKQLCSHVATFLHLVGFHITLQIVFFSVD